MITQEKLIHPNLDEYESVYGDLPNETKELISFLKKELKLTDKELIQEINRIDSIQWFEKNYTFYLVPKGTPRPRSSGGHFYVKGAKQMHKVFQLALKSEGIICTRCDYNLTVYLPTPINSMSKKEILLAELGYIRPVITPDWDNLAKTYTDCLQGFLLLNDSQINPGCVKKYYSIKPRINIHLRYQSDFDSVYNRRKILNTSNYKNLVEGM